MKKEMKHAKNKAGTASRKNRPTPRYDTRPPG